MNNFTHSGGSICYHQLYTVRPITSTNANALSSSLVASPTIYDITLNQRARILMQKQDCLHKLNIFIAGSAAISLFCIIYLYILCIICSAQYCERCNKKSSHFVLHEIVLRMRFHFSQNFVLNTSHYHYQSPRFFDFLMA